MKKDKSMDPGEEIIYKLSLKPEFIRDIQLVRSELKIPEGGFILGTPDYSKWLKRDWDPVTTADTWDRLCKKYRIPFAYAFYLHDYISYSRTFPDHDVSFVT
ncbi:MAG: hypothetical protein PHI06_12500, partial [Desulfobulbaceae bacterium]|nr:hypothetical protein [Desulfobulbaceae bacterium]